MTVSAKTRSKKAIMGMLPVKKWLDIQEATAYTNLCRNSFLKFVAPYVTVSMLGPKPVYKVEQIDSLIEENILITIK